MTEQSKPVSNPTVQEIAKKLNRVEETTVVGVASLTPKQSLIDASAVQKQHSNSRVRWVSLRDPQKIESRKAEGYTIVPADQGGRRLGDALVLMEIPRAQYDAKIKQQEAMNKARLHQHKDEMQRVVESVVKQMRDRGIDVSKARILIEEA